MAGARANKAAKLADAHIAEASIAQLKDVSMRSIAAILQQDRHRVDKQFNEINDVTTPYGPLVATIELPQSGEENYTWRVANPFALLYVFCSASAKFAELLRHCVGAVRAGLAIYTDEADAATVIRPDCAREAQCIYWTVLQLPTWLRQRKRGWFVFGYLPMKIQKKLPAGLSSLTRIVLRYFFSQSWFNFHLGLRLPIGATGEVFHFIATLACTLQDGKAMQASNLVKGAAGHKCCQECKNIMNCKPETIAEDPYLRHYSLASHPSQFDVHTTESFFQMCDLLEAVFSENMTPKQKAEFERLEKAYGLRYDVDGLLWDKYLRQYYNPPQHAYHDPMHVLVASGGVVQYEINYFMLAATQLDPPVQLEDVDAITQLISFPNDDSKRLPKTFWKDRVVFTEGAHLRAFAGECLDALKALVLYWEMCLRPDGKMLQHGLCLMLLLDICDICFSGDKALPFVSALMKLISEHHALFVSVYGADKMKPKFHQLFHVALSMFKVLANLNCFRMEKMHQLAKSYIRTSRGARWEDYCLKRSLFEMIFAMKDESTFEEITLANPRHPAPELLPALAPLMAPCPIGLDIVAGMLLRCSAFTLKKGCIVSMVSNGALSIGKAMLFARASEPTRGRVEHFAFIVPYVPCAPVHGVWQPGANEMVPIDVASISSVLPYAPCSGPAIRPLLRWYDKHFL